MKVVMTPAAREFITPLTLSTLSKNPVYWEFTSGNQGEWNNHVELAQWADMVVIAPATANIIAKIANGICDNLLLAVYLACPLPEGSKMSSVFIAPAMDLDMFQHPATKANLQRIESFGNNIIPPDSGELASGLEGEGRMAEPEAIIRFISGYLKKKSPLEGKRALVTAGPTHEAIDPVRFISNNSSGKMGFAIAEELAGQGAEVTLVCGPNTLSVKHNSIKRIDVVSADEMYSQCLKQHTHSDITVMAAAVADFKPARVGKEKIKKNNKVDRLDLVPTKDILSELGSRKNGSLLVGFALETEKELANAKKKLHNKNLDFIVLNSLKDEGSGFGHDTNKITIIDNRTSKRLKLMSKREAAREIVKEIIRRIVKK